MACYPSKQLYDCERRDSTNTTVFSVLENTIAKVTSEGLADGQTIPILVKDETGEYVPYILSGEQVVLSEDQPSLIIEEEGMYKLDVSEIECPETGITVESQLYPSEVSTSITACYTDEEGNQIPVEIIRYTDTTIPVVYNLGTGERIANPTGTFTQECSSSDDPTVIAITDVEFLGCVLDEEDELLGKVYFVPEFDGDGNMTSNRLVMVLLDGSVVDPYEGSWTQCNTESSAIDVEIHKVCLLNDGDNSVVDEMFAENLYDSEGALITTRYVHADGSPVAFPAQTHVGFCPPADNCPYAFATECWSQQFETRQYDNGYGSATSPSDCGAPISGPVDTGASGPAFGCTGVYQITSWIVDGVELLPGGTTVAFSGTICGEDEPGVGAGMHRAWANALTSIDPDGQWEVRFSSLCAHYIASVNPPKEYGQMTIQDANDTSRVWVLDGTTGVTEKTYTRVLEVGCDNVVTERWLDDSLVEVEKPDYIVPCGSSDNESERECVSCETLILCDSVVNPDESKGIPWNVVNVEPDAENPDQILHYSLSPVDDPTKVGVVTFQTSSVINSPACADPEISPWMISNSSTRTMTLDAVAQEMNSLQVFLEDFDNFEPTYIVSPTPLPDRLGGTAYWDGEPGYSSRIRPTENNNTGILYWDNPPATIEYGVTNTGGGTSCSAVSFAALTLSTMQRPFMRTICRDCEGNIVSVTDTEMDGETPYSVVGQVTLCGDEPEELEVSSFETQLFDSEAPVSESVILPQQEGKTLVGWTVRNRTSTNATIQVNGNPVLPIDEGETISSGGVDEDGGALNDTVTVIPGDGSVRITVIRRLP